MQLRAVIFDVDGLMLDTESVAREIWMSEASRMGFPMDAKLYKQLIGRTYPDIEKLLHTHYAGRTDVRTYIDGCLAAYVERIRKPIAKRPGLEAVLKFCETRSLRRAVGTSAGRSLVEIKLRSGGVEGRFEVIVTGSDVSRGKPAPDGFLECTRRLALGAGECLVLEDSPSGVKAAKAAGMRVLMIPDLIAPEDAERRIADAILPTLADVPAYIEQSGWLG